MAMSSTYMGTYCPSQPSLCATKDVTYLAFLGSRKGEDPSDGPRPDAQRACEVRSQAREGVKKSDWPSVAALYERRSH